MRRLLCWTCAALTAIAPANAWALPVLELEWTQTLTPGANAYYLNDNTDGSGALVGQITYGVRHVHPNGTQLHATALSSAAKSIVRLGDYYFVTGDNAQGVGRLDATGPDAWNRVNLWAATVPVHGGPLSTRPLRVGTHRDRPATAGP